MSKALHDIAWEREVLKTKLAQRQFREENEMSKGMTVKTVATSHTTHGIETQYELYTDGCPWGRFDTRADAVAWVRENMTNEIAEIVEA